MTEQKKVDRAGAAETSHIAADPAPARRRRQTAARKQEAVLRVPTDGLEHLERWMEQMHDRTACERG